MSAATSDFADELHAIQRELDEIVAVAERAGFAEVEPLRSGVADLRARVADLSADAT